jgi:diguanylate cyclase (GGDEF)-like protein/PAS domain S-box-containing protein
MFDRMARLLGWRRLRALSPATTLTLEVGLIVTGILYATVHRLEYRRAWTEFEQVAGERFTTVEHGLDEVTHAARALNLLFVVSETVTRTEFETYGKTFLSHNPFLQALVFRRFVTEGERARFEAERRRQWPGFQITQREDSRLTRAPPRSRYLVADYVVPLKGNQGAFGSDTWFDENFRNLVQRAIDSNAPASSSQVRVPQVPGEDRALVMVMPAYRTGARLPDVAARRANAIGVTEVVADVSKLIGGALGRADLLSRPGIVLTVSRLQGGHLQPGYAHDTVPPDVAAMPEWLRRILYAEFSESRAFDFDGNRWVATVACTDGGVKKSVASLGTLLFGLLLTAAAGTVVELVTSGKKRIEGVVRERTSELAQATDKLRLYKRAIDSSANPIMLIDATDSTYPVKYVNQAYERTLGYQAGEVVGHSLAERITRFADQPGLVELRTAIRERREGHSQVRHTRKDGSVIYSEVYIAPVRHIGGQTDYFVINLYDVTTTKQYEATLEHRARYDTLTGLPNRMLLVDRIGQAITNAHADGESVCVAVIDLDQFKTVNDTLGHAAGNEVLKLLAPRLVGVLAPTDTVARPGGDEFVLALPGCNDESCADIKVRSAMEVISGAPTSVRGHNLVLTCSAGLAMFPIDGGDAETLIRHAEIAMYRAKERGRNSLQFFTASMNQRAFERFTLESALREAVARGQFEVHYQPQVELTNGGMAGVEALVRWRHPEHGMVRPDRFIALAEETGLIAPIGAWVLHTACAQCRAWQDAGLGPVRMAVNLSARQFADENLKQAVAAVLADTGLAATSLEIELTESLIMDNVDAAIRTMRELKAMGVKLSIDDFGTGYSSLSYLRRFPADVLKIDQSFVTDVPASRDAAALVDAIISLAHGLNLHVIAEGVETEEQAGFLRGSGCDEVQGYLYSKAIPGPEVERMLREGWRAVPA